MVQTETLHNRISDFRDSCGFAMLAHLKGERSHWLVERTLESLHRLTHRGALGADGKSGDGCGITLQFPKKYYRQLAQESNIEISKRFASGLVFFSHDRDLRQQRKHILSKQLEQCGLTVAGWRRVPTEASVVGRQAAVSLPHISQIFVNAPRGWNEHDIERQLFIARRMAYAEQSKLDTPDPLYYVVSLSNLVVVYKGLIQPEHLADFYPDLKDKRLKSAIGLCHQRFSTNTLPRWNYAQPFRFLAHNGEINSITGNRSWARARAGILKSPLLPALREFEHLVNQTGSDSSSLDNMLEIFMAGGMDIFRAMRLLMPPATHPSMDADLKAFIEFNSMHQEPWDGPAGIITTNGRIACCNLDRNGLRPARFTLTKQDIFTVASETGVWDYAPEDISEQGNLGPGEMVAIDTRKGKVWHSKAIDDVLKARHTYREWMSENVIRVWNNDEQEREAAKTFMRASATKLPIFQKLFLLSREECEAIIKPLCMEAAEPTGSMGDDTPMAVLSRQHRSIYDYFRQSFAQVTNPPIDSLREASAMSLETCIGREHNVFNETRFHAHRVLLPWPILNYVKYQTLLNLDQRHYQIHHCSLNYAEQDQNLRGALEGLAQSCVNAVQAGATLLVLTDRDIQPDRLTMPAPLAVGAVHQALVNSGDRCNANIILETGSARDAHQCAVLLGLGATAIYPYLAFQTINQLHANGVIQGDLIKLRKSYRRGIRKGLLKILSKMGICTIASYRGSELFEAVGLAQEVTRLCCPNVSSKIQGAGFDILEAELKQLRDQAWNPQQAIGLGGLYRYKHGEEFHAYHPGVVLSLQQAVNSGRWQNYQRFSESVDQRPVTALRDLLQLRDNVASIDLDQVEPESAIVKRFDSAGMSIGALSPEAHEALAVAMNSLGGRSNSGEGGEDASRFNSPRNSKIKQVASGRFGVTAHYLRNAEVLQIKIAQGAKPGEGGQLPGKKVTAEIAALRHSMPGVTLISPPPHHDIYSIEDLAQLIFDLKQVNPQALVSVKLVSNAGIGTIAVGVAKAYADLITVSGYDGGTGASPLSSVKYAGTPWEIGLPEVHQALVENDLRNKIRLQVDGGLKSGLDVIKGAILGAESFGFGTGPMVALGCKYLRICHLNNCATGVATQNKILRQEHFSGLPEKVINYFNFLARDVRQHLARLGVARLTDIIGRVDLLEVLPGDTAKHQALELQPILASAGIRSDKALYCDVSSNPPHDNGRLNRYLLDQAKPHIAEGKPWRGSVKIKNYDRSVGAALAGEIARRHGREGLPEDSIAVDLQGTAGQSFGVWNSQGISLRLNGDANDYTGKGMSGGRIVLWNDREQSIRSRRNVICGNACLYGATGGEFYAMGTAGERFAVRNSGAIAVVEGVGQHACEYMTGGSVVILGEFGPNLAAGMTGGELFVLDQAGRMGDYLNTEFVQARNFADEMDESTMMRLQRLIRQHVKHTGSAWGQKLLAEFDLLINQWVRITPSRTPAAATESDSPAIPLQLVKS